MGNLYALFGGYHGRYLLKEKKTKSFQHSTHIDSGNHISCTSDSTEGHFLASSFPLGRAQNLIRITLLKKFVFLISVVGSPVLTVSQGSKFATAMPTSNTGKEPVRYGNSQVFVDGFCVDEKVQQLIKENNGHFKLFGYGSFCWDPGDKIGLSRASRKFGRVLGYKRVWAQRSTDQCGTVDFPGILCTLLKEQEYKSAQKSASTNKLQQESIVHSSAVGSTGENTIATGGVIFDVPPDLVERTLQELDLQEKTGYAIDVCDVVEEGSQRMHRALLYRLTPDNPAFSSIELLDLSLSAAIISISSGPSG